MLRIRELLARPALFPSEARELRVLAERLGVDLQWEWYNLAEPWRGWRPVREPDGNHGGAMPPNKHMEG